MRLAPNIVIFESDPVRACELVQRIIHKIGYKRGSGVWERLMESSYLLGE